MRITVGSILGPLLAGVLADYAGLGVVYGLAALLYIPALATLWLMNDPAQDKAAKQRLGFAMLPMVSVSPIAPNPSGAR